MNTGPSLYRTTLIAAAVAFGCLGTAAAQAHDHGWRDHDDGWQEHDRSWHEHDRSWRARDGHRAHGPRYGFAAPDPRDGGYAPPVAYYPAPMPASGPGGVSVVVRLPL